MNFLLQFRRQIFEYKFWRPKRKTPLILKRHAAPFSCRRKWHDFFSLPSICRRKNIPQSFRCRILIFELVQQISHDYMQTILRYIFQQRILKFQRAIRDRPRLVQTDNIYSCQRFNGRQCLHQYLFSCQIRCTNSKGHTRQ